MKFDIQKLFNIDRRIIFVFIFLSVLIPFLVDFELPIKPNKNVQRVYDDLEKVAAKNGTILVSFDFDNASKAELEPMAKAIISFAFEKNIKVVGMGLWPNGVNLARNTFTTLAKKYKKEIGKDWTYLGYKAGALIVIVAMGKDFLGTLPLDFKENKTAEMEITRDIRTLKDFDYVITLSAGSGGLEEWVVYGQSKVGFELGGGCTAVMAPDFFPYLQSGQLNGLIGGLAGAAQFEFLVGKPGSATVGMKPQSVAHIVLIFFILFGNICYFMDKYLKKRQERKDEA